MLWKAIFFQQTLTMRLPAVFHIQYVLPVYFCNCGICLHPLKVQVWSVNDRILSSGGIAYVTLSEISWEKLLEEETSEYFCGIWNL